MLSLRAAVKEDEPFWYAVRNEPETRAVSRRTHILDRAEYRDWFMESIAGETRRLFTITVNGDPVGQLHLDLSDGTAEISLALTRGAQGQGYGKQAIRLALAETPLPVTAVVKRSNPVSLAVFKSCGFVTEHEDNGFVHLVYRRSMFPLLSQAGSAGSG